MKYKLELYLPKITNITCINSAEEVDQLADQLSEAITKAIADATPRKRTCHRSKRWWNSNLTDVRKESNRLRNRFTHTDREEDCQQWKEKRKELRKSIRQAKRD